MTTFISRVKRSGWFDFYPFNASVALRRTHARKWYVVSIISLVVASFDPLPDGIQFVALIIGGVAAAVLGFLLY